MNSIIKFSFIIFILFFTFIIYSPSTATIAGNYVTRIEVLKNSSSITKNQMDERSCDDDICFTPYETSNYDSSNNVIFLYEIFNCTNCIKQFMEEIDNIYIINELSIILSFLDSSFIHLIINHNSKNNKTSKKENLNLTTMTLTKIITRNNWIRNVGENELKKLKDSIQFGHYIESLKKEAAFNGNNKILSIIDKSKSDFIHYLVFELNLQLNLSNSLEIHQISMEESTSTHLQKTHVEKQNEDSDNSKNDHICVYPYPDRPLTSTFFKYVSIPVSFL